MTEKYAPLERYLHGISLRQSDITMTFAQIEQILKNKLPPSAYQHRAWWANERHGQTRQCPCLAGCELEGCRRRSTEGLGALPACIREL